MRVRRSELRYDAILIDLDGVVRRWPDSDETIEVAHGLAVGSIRQAAFSPDLVDLAVTGAISDEEWRTRVVDRLRQRFGQTRATDAVAAWSAQPGDVDQDVMSLLRACDASIKRVLVTNATSRLSRDIDALGLAMHFDAIVNSSDVGACKPAASMFLTALQQVGVAPEAALFVDDTADNVVAAAALGIRSHHFVGAVGLATFLTRAGVLDEKAR